MSISHSVTYHHLRSYVNITLSYINWEVQMAKLVPAISRMPMQKFRLPKNNRAEIDAGMTMCFVCACEVAEGEHQALVMHHTTNLAYLQIGSLYTLAHFWELYLHETGTLIPVLSVKAVDSTTSFFHTGPFMLCVKCYVNVTLCHTSLTKCCRAKCLPMEQRERWCQPVAGKFF